MNGENPNQLNIFNQGPVSENEQFCVLMGDTKPLDQTSQRQPPEKQQPYQPEALHTRLNGRRQVAQLHTHTYIPCTHSLLFSPATETHRAPSFFQRAFSAVDINKKKQEHERTKHAHLLYLFFQGRDGRGLLVVELLHVRLRLVLDAGKHGGLVVELLRERGFLLETKTAVRAQQGTK